MTGFKPTHITCKAVEARAITAAEFAADGSGKIWLQEGRVVEAPVGFASRYAPAEGDILLRYFDGYLSHCPADVFHRSARPVLDVSAMTFGDALVALKAGGAVCRQGWNGKGMFIVLMPPLYLPPFNTQDTARKVNDRTAKWIGEDAPLDCQPYLAMFTASKQWQPGWLASQADMLAEDWMVLPEKTYAKAA